MEGIDADGAYAMNDGTGDPCRRVICVVHGESSSTGRIGRVLREKGYEEVRCCVKTGDVLPEDFHDIAGAVIFGGPMSANDDGTLGFIAAELRWIDRVLEAGTPFLGVCLGAQMLARSLGAAVQPHDDGWHEIGFTDVVPTQAGRPVLGNLRHVYQWHCEGFDLPWNCALLATGATERFPNQMFSCGPNVYGVQFHPECTIETIREWMKEGAEELDERGAQQPEEQLADAARYDHLVDAWMPGFFDHWLGAAAPGRAAAA